MGPIDFSGNDAFGRAGTNSPTSNHAPRDVRTNPYDSSSPMKTLFSLDEELGIVE
jgi:hypothetical protein